MQIPLKKIFNLPHLILVSVLSLPALLGPSIPSLDTLERRLLDVSFQIRGAEPPHPDIVIIEINDQSLRRIGSWPWPRSYHAALLEILSFVKPSAVFFDMLFSEKSTPAADQAFSERIQKSGNVILAFYFPASDPQSMTTPPDGLPIPMLRNYAKGLGYANVFPDKDGHIREVVLRHKFKDRTFLHASLAIAAAHGKWTPEDLEKIVPEQGCLVNFPGPYEGFNVIPYEYLTSSFGYAWAKPVHESLRGKVILVGHTAAGTAMDLKPTAFSSQYQGVGIQASMVHTLLTGKFIRKIPRPWVWALLLFFSFGMVAITKLTSPLQGFLYSFFSLVIVFEIVQVLFIYFRIWLPFGGFLIAGSMIYLGLTLFSFVKVYVEREVMTRELSLASKIQSNFLLQDMPEIPGLQLAAITIPARHVGGDLYDLLPLENNRCGISIGDVSGKGVPAALFMARAISEFRREARHPDPGVVVKNLNGRLAEGGFSGLFITLLYVVIDMAQKKMTYANGGHEPIFFYQKEKNAVALLMTESGGPLGIDTETVFDQKEATVAPGDIILLDSDGIKEAWNAKKEIFGNERIQAAIMEAKDKDPQGVIDHVRRRIEEFIKNAPQHDDMTIVCAKFT